MIRPWHIWTTFALGVLVVAGAMTWTTQAVWNLETKRLNAQQRAQHEEIIRLALWRLDSALAPLLTRENSIPTHQFRSAKSYSTSPLYYQNNPLVWLHFEVSSKKFISPEILSQKLQPQKKKAIRRKRQSRWKKLESLVSHSELSKAWKSLPVPRVTPLPAPQELPALALAGSNYQSELNKGNWKARSRYTTMNTQTNVALQQKRASAPAEAYRPLWMKGELFLIRPIARKQGSAYQGCWLRWQEIQNLLLAEIEDLLPKAELVPTTDQKAISPSRTMVTLPVALQVPPPPSVTKRPWSPVYFGLMIAWIAVSLAALIVALVLGAALSLSERRRTFVSAVTHELRTPLTTLQMYSDMLNQGMVATPEKEKHYLKTIQGEATRLGHLVENVLAYSRLEGGRGDSRREVLPLGKIVDQCGERLQQRAEQSGMEWQVSGPDGETGEVEVDLGLVEQILFNLVDNSGKYGSRGEKKVLEVNWGVDGKRGWIEVRDYGPGISDSQTRRLFQPFSKSAEEAAHSTPGVGLGLSLSRRLARSFGGNLQWNRDVTPGASFTLYLPRAK